MRKGQVTLFIIAGIVVVVIAAILFYLRGSSVGQNIDVPVEAQPVKVFVDACLKSTAIKGIQLLGIQGGYVMLDKPYLQTEYSKISYHFIRNNKTYPSDEEVENEISFFIGAYIQSCIQGFTIFKEQGYDIKEGNISVKANINENKVDIDLNYPLELGKGEARNKLESFSVDVPIRLGHILDISRKITDKAADDPESMDMDFLSGFDVQLDVLPFNMSSLVFSINDEKSEGQYIFLFAHDYILNKPPTIDIPDHLVFSEEYVNFKIGASDPENDPLTFSDNTALFDIQQDGTVEFWPDVPGEYNATITVEDSYGNSASANIRFTIEES